MPAGPGGVPSGPGSVTVGVSLVVIVPLAPTLAEYVTPIVIVPLTAVMNALPPLPVDR